MTNSSVANAVAATAATSRQSTKVIAASFAYGIANTPPSRAAARPPARPCMNMAGWRTVNSTPERYKASSIGRVLAWFTSDRDGW